MRGNGPSHSSDTAVVATAFKCNVVERRAFFRGFHRNTGAVQGLRLSGGGPQRVDHDCLAARFGLVRGQWFDGTDAAALDRRRKHGAYRLLAGGGFA
ncbi:hypothetical protein D3C73_1344160 [compost metagenome]